MMLLMMIVMVIHCVRPDAGSAAFLTSPAMPVVDGRETRPPPPPLRGGRAREGSHQRRGCKHRCSCSRRGHRRRRRRRPCGGIRISSIAPARVVMRWWRDTDELIEEGGSEREGGVL